MPGPLPEKTSSIREEPETHCRQRPELRAPIRFDKVMPHAPANTRTGGEAKAERTRVMTIRDIATAFADACDTGKGWTACKQWCHDDATFRCQADALADLASIEAYVEWAASLLGPMPDARYELSSIGVDEKRNIVTVASVFLGTHTVDGPAPATGKSVATDYVYVLHFDGDRIRSMDKIWNDGHALRQLGWA